MDRLYNTKRLKPVLFSFPGGIQVYTFVTVFVLNAFEQTGFANPRRTGKSYYLTSRELIQEDGLQMSFDNMHDAFGLGAVCSVSPAFFVSQVAFDEKNGALVKGNKEKWGKYSYKL
jgi:hypothetical protein